MGQGHQTRDRLKASAMTLALVLEHEASAALALRGALEVADYRVVIVRHRDEFEGAISTGPDVVVLGRLSDPADPALACRLLRQRLAIRIPIVVIGRNGSDLERQDIIAAGASDYLSPPVSGPLLVTRVRNCLRSTNPQSLGTILISGDLVLDDEHHRVTRKSRDVHLSPGAYDLLRLLMTSPDHTFSREEILEKVWGDTGSVELRNVDLVLKRLRASLREGRRTDPITTIRGVGYRMADGSRPK